MQCMLSAVTSYIIHACPCKSSDVFSLKYMDICGVFLWYPKSFLDWISGFQIGFLDFRVDFWISGFLDFWISGFQIGFQDFRVGFCISDWISGFHSGFLPTVYKISFEVDPSGEGGGERDGLYI